MIMKSPKSATDNRFKSIFDQVNLIRRNVFQVKMSGLIYKVQSPLLNSHLYFSYHRRFHMNQNMCVLISCWAIIVSFFIIIYNILFDLTDIKRLLQILVLAYGLEYILACPGFDSVTDFFLFVIIYET
jgi:predicted Kef-type K+ transport protein